MKTGRLATVALFPFVTSIPHMGVFCRAQAKQQQAKPERPEPYLAFR
jgi:hypothetical protein